jgi:hypothetical protein
MVNSLKINTSGKHSLYYVLSFTFDILHMNTDTDHLKKTAITEIMKLQRMTKKEV